MTVREWVAHWQTDCDIHRSRPTTYAAHEYIFKNHILPSLGEIQLSELTKSMVEAFLDACKHFGSHRAESPDYPGLSDVTMRHIHCLLRQCLEQAVREGILQTNPARSFHYAEPKRISANVLTPLEMEDYLDAAERLGYLPMFFLELTVGLRQGELIALKWSDLNEKERTLTIREQRSVERRELVEYGAETRTITLTRETVDLLATEHAKHPGSQLLFMHPATQKPFSRKMVRRMHEEILAEAGLDHIRFSDLRHTFATTALQNGVDIKTVSSMLGHSSAGFTLNTYTHATSKAQEEAAETMGNFMRQRICEIP